MLLIFDGVLIVRKGIVILFYIDLNKLEKKFQDFISGNSQCSYNFRFCRGYVKIFILLLFLSFFV